MEVKDKSFNFDFVGTYTAVKKHELLEYTIKDVRHVIVLFEQQPEVVRITTTFEPIPGNPDEMEHGRWQAILNNFEKYAEINK